MARDERPVGRQDLRHEHPTRREVERRQASHRRGREVLVRDRQARGLGVLHDVEDRPFGHPGQGQQGQLHLHEQAELPRLEHDHLHAADRAEAHLVGLQRNRDHDGQHRQHVEDGRHRPVRLRRRQGLVRDAAVEPAQQLVGDEGPRDEDADAVRRRHPQQPEHRVAAELPQERHRPEQQLLPRCRQGDRREGADVLPEGAVHAVGEHGLARAEHDARAAERRARSAGRSRCRSTSTRS